MAFLVICDVLGAVARPISTDGITINVDPEHPIIPNWTPLGALVSTVTITVAGGGPYGGTPSLNDPDGIYALVAGPSTGVFYLIVDPNGFGVGPEGGTIDNVVITAN